MSAIIGLDPGLVATGIASIRGDVCVFAATIRTGLIVDAIKELSQFQINVPVAVQVPCRDGQKSPRFHGGGGMSLVRHALFCGEIIGRLRAHGYRVIEVSALDCRRAPMKLDAKLWCAAWHWTGTPPSEHARDAAEIARIGRRMIQEQGT